MAQARRRQSTQAVRRVALLVQTTHQWHRDVLRGVAAYAQERTQWDFYFEPRGLLEKMCLPRSWKPDGIITRLTHPALARSIRRLQIPAVNVSWLGRHQPAIPRVVSDEAECGRLAARYLLDQAFRSFCYVGPVGRPAYSRCIGQEFAATVAAEGYPCDVLLDSVGDVNRPLHEQRPVLLRWLRRLPKPTAMLVWNGEIGREVTAACTALDLQIPDQIAVLCIEDDMLMSSLAPVPLSTLDQLPHRVGYEAAELLDRMMSGEAAPAEPHLIPPSGVIARRSTDTMAVDDAIVRQAVRFIRDNVHTPIQVVDVHRTMNLSRRALEHRFVQVLGRTPAAEIRRVRLQRVCRLLVDTDLTVGRIAEESGFVHSEVMTRLFHREMGIPPSEYRARRRYER